MKIYRMNFQNHRELKFYNDNRPQQPYSKFNPEKQYSIIWWVLNISVIPKIAQILIALATIILNRNRHACGEIEATTTVYQSCCFLHFLLEGSMDEPAKHHGYSLCKMNTIYIALSFWKQFLIVWVHFKMHSRTICLHWVGTLGHFCNTTAHASRTYADWSRCESSQVWILPEPHTKPDLLQSLWVPTRKVS